MPARNEFLLITMGSAGDVYPFIGLAIGLQKQGYRAQLATHVRYQKVVQQAGLTCIPFGNNDDFDKLGENPLIWHPFKAFDFLVQEAIFPAIEPIWEILENFDPAKTTLVSTVLCFSARMAQEKRGFKHATAVLQPSLFSSAIKPPVLHPYLRLHSWIPLQLRRLIIRAMHSQLDKKFLPYLDDFRRKKGLASVRGIMNKWVCSPDLVLCLFPQWFAQVQQDWPRSSATTDFLSWDQKKKDEYFDDVAEFIQGDKPVIFFTPGSEMLQGKTFFKEALGALNRLGIKGIFVSRQEDQLPQELPENVRAYPYLSFSRVFPLVDAAVFHGGVGTLAKTFRAGIPQLIMPMSFDQPDNAARAKALGTGDFLVRSKFTSERIAVKLNTLLFDSTIKANCQRIKRLMGDPSGEEQSLKLLASLADSK